MGALFSVSEISSMSGGIKPPAPKNYRLPDKFPSLRGAKLISFDLEGKDESIANDLGPGWFRDAWICGFSIGIGDRDGNIEFSEYYPTRHTNGPSLDEEKVFEWLTDELSFYDGEILGANLLYDAIGVAVRKKIYSPLAKWRDIQWSEALIDENAFSYQLERIANKYLGEGKVTDELKALYGPGYKERMPEIHPGHMRAYGIGDIELPIRLYPAQLKELHRQKLYDLFDLECRLLPMLVYMRQKGQRVDLDKAAQLHDQFKTKRAESLREATRLIGKRGFELNTENFGRPSVLVEAMDILGIKYPRTAPTAGHPDGQPSITDKWLQAQEHPACAHIAAANQFDKALETFVNGYVSDFQINGRIHCEFHPLRKVDEDGGSKNGTVSGRFSSSHPNLQNIPARDDVIGPLCRAMFIPEEGYDFFSGDYSQIEYREIVHAAVIRAKLAKPDKRWGKDAEKLWNQLQSAYKAQDAYINKPDTDFHTMTAELTKLPRKRAKSINFGIAFCMGVASLAGSLGLLGPDGKPLKEALDIMDAYHGEVPFVKAVATACSLEAQHDGFITTLLGRRAHFDLWEPKFQDGAVRAKALPYEEAVAAYGDKLKRARTHKALNSFTQGGGADLMKSAMVAAWEAGLLDGDDLIISLTVHDELDGSVARTKAGDEKLAELKHIMETIIPLTVPTPAEFARGANWAETH